MKTEDLILDKFFKQFKTGVELNDFLKSIQKRSSEKMLDGEQNAHLDYSKHDQHKDSNSRNGYSSKQIKTSNSDEQMNLIDKP